MLTEVFRMAPSSTPDSEEQLFVEAARTSYRRLKEWERQHPNATLGEIEQKTREERRLLMAQLIPWLLADRRHDVPLFAATKTPRLMCTQPTVPLPAFPGRPYPG